MVNRLLQEKDTILINQANKDGVTPLNVASDQGHTAVVRILLQHLPGLDLNLKDKWGNTALMAAREKNGKNKEYFTMLSKMGITKGCKNFWANDPDPSMTDGVVNTDDIVQLLTNAGAQ